MFDRIDKYLTHELSEKYGSSFERRDYYELEISYKTLLKGKGKEPGLMFLIDVTDNHYIYINLYKEGNCKMVFTADDNCMTRNMDIKHVEILFPLFIKLVDEFIGLCESFNKFNYKEVSKQELRNHSIKSIID
jgi:hypothetical protein